MTISLVPARNRGPTYNFYIRPRTVFLRKCMVQLEGIIGEGLVVGIHRLVTLVVMCLVVLTLMRGGATSEEISQLGAMVKNLTQ